MIERRIEELAREMREPDRIPTVRVDEEPLDNALRFVAILILVVLVFAFVTWPREEPTRTQPVRAEEPVAMPAAPARGGGGPEPDTRIGALEYSPIY
ncbi:MAG TPA: hypothetical protein VFJ62_07710 [Usitatibacter sp.]|nr:hypothetical protein [Usitatibacter sp.]